MGLDKNKGIRRKRKNHLLILNSLSHLDHLSEPSAQDWQEDTSDTDMVPGLGNPCVLSFYQHCDAARDISHGHLVALREKGT